MPDNLFDWLMISYLSAGALGGVLYLADRIVNMITPKPEPKYNPWEEMTRASVPARIEPPISARRK